VTDTTRYALCVATFYEEIAERLVEGARRVLQEAGAEVDVHAVPGAFELPLAAKHCAESGRYEGVACLGCVIRGETDHYEHIAREASAGLAAVARETGVPVGFGVLTVEEEAQARGRAQDGPGNKGAEAARAAVAMVHVLRQLQPDGHG
jgi:6,7-dimethyl-8-ribityllumazine synthase